MFHLYGFFVGIAIVAGWSVAEKVEPKVNKVLPWLILTGFLGARIYHVVDMWEYYLVHKNQIFALWNGGLGIWGGIFGGLIGLLTFYYLNKNLKQFWASLGAIATGLPLAQAIGRLGNGVNREFGELVMGFPWWMAEALLDFVLFLVLMRSKRFLGSPKRIVSVYLIGYGLIRFVLEFWRTNNWIIGVLGVAQWVSLTSVVIGLLIWLLSVRD